MSDQIDDLPPAGARRARNRVGESWPTHRGRRRARRHARNAARSLRRRTTRA